MNPITVLLADDHQVVRECLLGLLAKESDLLVVGEAKNGRQAVALAGTLGPAVVVMDISMPVLDGLEATRQITCAVPAIRVLILSSHCEDCYVERARAMGAAGYVTKHSASDFLVGAIREVCNSSRFVNPCLAQHLDIGDKQREIAADLNACEIQVLQLIAMGKTRNEIADALHIGIKTVDALHQRVMTKLSISDTAGLTRYAVSVGIIESSVQVSIL